MPTTVGKLFASAVAIDRCSIQRNPARLLLPASLAMSCIRKRSPASCDKLNSTYQEAKMRYLVMIRRTRTGYSVDVPDLPGCVATGSTVEHARQMIAEAIEMHLELMQERGEAVPQPATVVSFAIDENAAEEFCTWVEVESPVASTS